MKFLTEALWVFVIFSFLGWAAQFVLMSIKQRRITNPGFLALPFVPIMGFGFFLLYVFVLWFDNITMLIITSALILTLYKYFAARLFERSFGFKWIEFKNNKFKLNAYVSVWEPLAYGTIGLFSVKFAFVPIPMLVSAMPFWLAILIPAVVTALIIIDIFISLLTVAKLRKNLKEMEDISKLLDSEGESVSNDELMREYERKMLKNKHFRLRLVKAFPDMQSYDYAKQFEDLKEHHNLVMERNNRSYIKSIEKKEDQPFAYGLSFYKLFWLFFIGSFFGTILETLWAVVIDGRFEMRVGMVIGPFIPVYGGGAVAITLCLYKLHKRNDVVVFLASAVIGAAFEYYCSYFQEMFLGTISWDYSDTPFNIDGRTNLTFALIWGFLGLVWLRYLYPFISRLIEKIPKRAGSVITIILIVFMVVNGALSIIAVDRKNKRAENIPPKTVIGQFCDTVFTDDYMNFIFPHMGTKETFEEGRKQESKQSSKDKK